MTCWSWFLWRRCHKFSFTFQLTFRCNKSVCVFNVQLNVTRGLFITESCQVESCQVRNNTTCWIQFGCVCVQLLILLYTAEKCGLIKTTINVFKLASCFPLTHIQLALHARTICTIPQCLHILPLSPLSPLSLSLSLKSCCNSSTAAVKHFLDASCCCALFVCWLGEKVGLRCSARHSEAYVSTTRGQVLSCCYVWSVGTFYFSSRSIFFNGKQNMNIWQVSSKDLKER